MTDWSDGRIDGSYPISCYRHALRALPEDIRLYSSAVDDIKRALAGRVQTTTRSLAGGFVANRSAAPSAAAAGSGADSLGSPLWLGGSLALLVAVLAGGTFVVRRKLPSNRTR